MDKNLSELYGQFSYGEQLTYEELLFVENKLITVLEELMDRAGAEHLDFSPLGDCLMVQCSFPAHKLYMFRKIALYLAGILPDHVTGRLLCLDKTLEASHVYWIQPGSWQEEERAIPSLPPDGLKSHTVPRNADSIFGSDDDVSDEEEAENSTTSATVVSEENSTPIDENLIADSTGK